MKLIGSIHLQIDLEMVANCIPHTDVLGGGGGGGLFLSIVIHIHVCFVMRSYCPEILVNLGLTKGPPPGPPHIKKVYWQLKSKIGAVWSLKTPSGPPNFTFWPTDEELVFKLFPLVVHMSPLWWGLPLLTFRCPWILCKGPTWPWIFILFFVFVYFNSKGSYQMLLY